MQFLIRASPFFALSPSHLAAMLWRPIHFWKEQKEIMKKVLHPTLGAGFLLLTMPFAAKAQVTNTSLTPTAGTTVNLTTEGTADWSHWGINGLVQDHKAVAGAPVGLISDETIMNASGSGAYGDNRVAYSWSDGTPTVSVVNSTTGIYQASGSFTFTVAADTTPRILKVYVGGVSVTATQFTATLSDNTSGTPDYTDTNLNDLNATVAPDGNHFYGVYSLTYKAHSAGQTLTISYSQQGGSGNITLQAATLIVAPTTPPPAPSGLAAIAGTNRVGLQWNASATAVSYNIKRNTAATGTFTTIGTSTSTNYQDTTAVNGTTYYYEVTAVNGVGESGPSNVASATPAVGLDGTGLTGNYYLNGTGSQTANVPGSAGFTFATTPNLTELDSTVNFDSGNGPIGTANAWPAQVSSSGDATRYRQ